MKTLHLSIIIIFSASLGIANNLVFADSANNVEILNIQTHPSTIKVGDAFTITATLVNNSPVPIFVEFSDCEGPFTTTFDNHVTIYHGNLTCAYSLFRQMLNSNEKTTKTSPGTILVYKATTPGTANATITFSYYVKNQTDPTQPNIEQTISKSLLFTIHDKNTITESLNTGKLPVANKILSPLKQFKSGIAAKDVKCKQGLELLMKSHDNVPACVKPTSTERLLGQGWVNPYNFNGQYIGKESISLSAYHGVSNETFYNNGTVASDFTIDVNINNFKPSNASLVLQVYYNDGTLYKTVSVPSGMIQPDGFYKYQLIAVSDENHPVPFKVVATYNEETAITYAPVFAHP